MLISATSDILALILAIKCQVDGTFGIANHGSLIAGAKAAWSMKLVATSIFAKALRVDAGACLSDRPYHDEEREIIE